MITALELAKLAAQSPHAWVMPSMAVTEALELFEAAERKLRQEDEVIDVHPVGEAS